jgi:hypothetical protein
MMNVEDLFGTDRCSACHTLLLERPHRVRVTSSGH